MNRNAVILTQLVFLISALVFLDACASSNLDRSYINDGVMQLKNSKSSSISPLSRLKNRSQTSGGGSCGVCAH